MLSRRDLNRALLARQMLLTRCERSPLEAVEALGGLQAQQARPPHVGLWSRLAGFRREDLARLATTRAVVRATLMRGTLHLVSAADYASFRPAVQPCLTSGMHAILRERLNTFPLADVLEEAGRLFTAKPHTFTELRAALVERFPGADERAMGYAVRLQIPLVITPTDHPWGYPADGAFTPAEAWLGHPLASTAAAHGLVRRYLAAFGPATAADVQAWSGLAGLAGVLDDLRPELATFRDERRREYFDLPGSPRPGGDVPAPPRYVAEFDNLVLSHADRTRVIADEHRPRVITRNALVLGTFLVDGFVAGTWKAVRQGKGATLAVSPFTALTPAVTEALEAEGEALIRFMEPDAARHSVAIERG